MRPEAKKPIEWASVIGLAILATACAQSDDAASPPEEEPLEAVSIEPPENDCAQSNRGDPGCE